jgi:hypothetical protein
MIGDAEVRVNQEPYPRFFVLLSLLSFSVAAGCGQSGSPQPAGNASNSPSGDAMAAVDAPVSATGQSGSGAGSSNDAAGVAPAQGDAANGPQPQTDAGGGAPDAGSGASDAGSGASDAGSGAPGTCQSLFCEGFETVAVGSPPDPAIWTRTSTDVVVDSTRGARGSKQSLHIPPLLSAVKYIRENKTIAAMGTTFYGRVFFWIDRQPLEKPASLYHWTLLEADELDNYNAGRVLRLGGHIEGSGTNWLRFNFQTHGNPGETGLSDMNEVLSTKRWYCAEFYYSLPNNEARFWLDGVEDPKLHWQGPMGGYVFPPAITWMTFGFAEYQAPQTPWEVWIDEIALDTKKIGCN